MNGHIAAGARVELEDGKLDILINNAGISGIQPILPTEQPLDNIKTTSLPRSA
jgi:NAD(P)-dependent dehydrogenase (short-subunit alcohol dehydrogenase family)